MRIASNQGSKQQRKTIFHFLPFHLKPRHLEWKRKARKKTNKSICQFVVENARDKKKEKKGEWKWVLLLLALCWCWFPSTFKWTKDKKLCNNEVMRVTAQWIILGWLILFVNKKDCSQTSCKFLVLSSSFIVLSIVTEKLTWKSSCFWKVRTSQVLINPDSLFEFLRLFDLILFNFKK